MEDETLNGKDQLDLGNKTLGQRLFDNVYLLLTLSILISFVIYNVWGLIKTLNVPPAP
ncbi:MAG: hypothetical protein KDD92_02990 [Caldilineaceae bacterium]|nr:hypothetical protein [Caldilineaceae bacterium]